MDPLEADVPTSSERSIPIPVGKRKDAPVDLEVEVEDIDSGSTDCLTLECVRLSRTSGARTALRLAEVLSDVPCLFTSVLKSCAFVMLKARPGNISDLMLIFDPELLPNVVIPENLWLESRVYTSALMIIADVGAAVILIDLTEFVEACSDRFAW